MHDPLTVAWEIKVPLFFKRSNTLYSDQRNEWKFYQLATIWHQDPERGPGGDDSCGWFKRAHHGDPSVLAEITRRFEEDWDRTWTYDPKEDGCAETGETKRTYCRGLLNPSGMPRFSTIGVVMNLFFTAARVHFRSDGLTNWKQARKFMQCHLFDIMLFAENPTDSLFDSLNCTFGQDSTRDARISGAAATIYGWILRKTRLWYRHPRWHVHHWRLQIHPWQRFKRLVFDRCSKCGKGFKRNEPVYGSWSGNAIWHERCQNDKPMPTP